MFIYPSVKRASRYKKTACHTLERHGADSADGAQIDLTNKLVYDDT